MNQLLNKLEKKFGRYAVPDLIKYVIVLYCAGAALGLINENIYYSYLSLNVEAVLHGQIWRLFTYLIEPYGFNRGMGFIVFCSLRFRSICFSCSEDRWSRHGEPSGLICTLSAAGF